jgi:ribosomal protein S2
MLQQFLMKNLIQNTIHLGHKKNLRNQKIKNLIIGYRNNIDILNLNITILNLIKISPLIKEILLYNQTFLCITNKKKKHTKFTLPIIYENWLPGNLTNYKNLKRLKKNNFQIKEFPKIIILLTHQKTYSIAKETNLIKIPLISIIDTNSENKNSTYSIPSNDNSFTSENHFINILQYIYLISYIEKLKKFNTQNFLIKNLKYSIKKKNNIIQNKNINILKYKKKKLIIFKNKKFKNKIILKTNKLNKVYIYNKKNKNKKLLILHKNKRYKTVFKLFNKKIKKFKLNLINTKFNYKLPRLDLNQ